MVRPPFIDAHVHFWDLSRPGYDWLRPPFRDDVPGGSPEPIAHTYGLDDYLAEAAAWNVQGIVHIDAGAGAPHARAETEWLQATADAQGLPQAIVAFAQLDDPGVEADLAFHAAFRNVRGVRNIVNFHADPALTYTARDVTADPAWQAGYALLARYGLSFDLHAYPSQFETLAALAARYPEIPVVVDHLGLAVAGDPGGWEVWRRGLKRFADLPHVSIKLSGAGFIHRPWTAESVRGAVLETLELFGTRRVMVATNFPTDRLFATMDHTLSSYETILQGLSPSEQRDLWGGNADRFYRLGLGL